VWQQPHPCLHAHQMVIESLLTCRTSDLPDKSGTLLSLKMLGSRLNRRF
jgi:hypothetical protein